ncbi:hypothetical protein Q4Q34_09065 [Flavivirga abyssicola]|uniref:hypothetical protein n=1 Tax=Flavivirga abyssicola TaxID=3063533 RepID=UPI0026DFCF44|nr:hypothetical protein [Flavivirga sp. MEBiC07777]WVK15177.1 hypothetical protein Q4Q34_09065 [Flavivirga sp. MEBiC07777]
MRIKTLSILSLLIMFFSCKKDQENSTNNTESNDSKEITEKDISKINYIDFALDLKTEDVVKDWQEYYQLQDAITNIKKGDLSFFNDNEENKATINTLLKELKVKIPKEINSPSIVARITALETKLYKLEGLSNLPTTSKKELTATIKDFLVAFSNLNLQINKKIEFDSRKIEKPE